ncbi:MAG: hypothetical protein KDA28_15150, partial [Phycisphaerales bacterium]|nr:hypothetical protein [Phycisphaerales bacterium]
AFFGPVGEEAGRAGFATLPELTEVHATLGRVEAFGDPSRPSAFSAVFTDGRDALVSLLSRSRDVALHAAGAGPTGTRPVPT